VRREIERQSCISADDMEKMGHGTTLSISGQAIQTQHNIFADSFHGTPIKQNRKSEIGNRKFII